MLTYRTIAEVYLLLRIVVTPTFCVFGWLLLGRAAAKHLHSFVHWFLPSMLGASLGTAGLLLDAYVNYFARRDYALTTVVYLLYVVDVPFHLVSFVRLWQTISKLLPSPDETPPMREADQDETVWPPQPKIPPDPNNGGARQEEASPPIQAPPLLRAGRSPTQLLGEPAMLEVKPILPEDWPLLKDVRLRALADAPEAFGTTLDQAQAYSYAEWQTRARRFSESPPAAGCLAFVNGAPCGMACAYPSEEDPDAAGLTAFWVAPKQRGQGVGDRMVAFVVNWASVRGFGTLRATAVEDNHRAIAFYERMGFQNTGESELFRGDMSKRIVVMRRRLER